MVSDNKKAKTDTPPKTDTAPKADTTPKADTAAKSDTATKVKSPLRRRRLQSQSRGAGRRGTGQL